MKKKKAFKSRFPDIPKIESKKAGLNLFSQTANLKTGFLISLLALLIRLFYLYDSSDNPIFSAPIIDANYYDQSANDLIQKGIFSDQFFFQGFFYPFFLAGVYALTGSSMLWAKIFQAFLGAATCGLTFLLGEKVFDRKIGVIAGVILSFYAPLFFFGGELLPTTWAAFWAVCLLLLLIHTQEKKTLPLCILLGFCMALSVLTRPTFIPFCILAFIWLAWKWVIREKAPRIVWSHLAATGLTFAVALVPVGLIAMKETGAFKVLPTSGAVNLYIGNNPETDETIAIRPGIRYDAIRNLAFKEGVVTHTEEERNRFLYGKVMSYVVNEPLSFVKGLIWKFLQFVSSRELPNNEDIYLFRDWSVLLSVLTWEVAGFGFPFGVILPLAAAGIVLCWRRIPFPLLLFPAVYAFGVILVHVNNRYRMPVIPVLCIFGAAGAVNFVSLTKRREYKIFGVLGAALGALLLAVIPGPFVQERMNFRAETYHLVAEYHIMRSHPEEALRALTLAINADNNHAEAHTSMGEVLQSLGKSGEAISSYREALRLQPDHFIALNNLGILLGERGNAQEGLSYLDQALKASPDARRWSEVQVNLGIALNRVGRLHEAEAKYREALHVTPDLPEAHNNLGIVLAKQGRFEEAIQNYREAIRLRPGYAQARRNLAAAAEKSARIRVENGPFSPVGVGPPPLMPERQPGIEKSGR